MILKSFHAPALPRLLHCEGSVMDIVERLRKNVRIYDNRVAERDATEAATEIERLRANRDRLVELLSDFIALIGTEECRQVGYSVYRDAIEAMAVAVNLGYAGPITLAHAQEVHDKAAAITKGCERT